LVEIGSRVVSRLLLDARSSRDRLIGVGVAISGQVDAEAGVCIQMQRFGWKDVPIAAMLAKALKVPVWVDNDANAFAVSQHLFGHGRGTQNLAAIAIGRGIGAGLVANGRLFRGASGAAGEFGHNFEQAGRICECGREGCLETYCADNGLLATWAERDPTAKRKTIGNMIAATARGDPIACEIVMDAGARIGRHIAALVNVFDPEIIVFGGEGIRFGRSLFDPMRQVLDKVSYPGTPKIAIDWEGTGWPRGAAALAIQHFFNFEVTGGFTSQPTEIRRNEKVA
jgi:predicted NBD/HSP70 family sugar kinase